jgi:hypothetical protein
MVSRCHIDFNDMKMFVEPKDINLHSGFIDFKQSINGPVGLIENELEL